jgi:potassium-transporting ATPase KdpC subunit
MKEHIRPALTLLAAFTVLTGLVYPLAVTAVAQLAFPHQANGSLVVRAGQPVGSELIGQAFTDPRVFWSRPSATTTPYDAAAGTGSNLGPTSPKLREAIAERMQRLREADPTHRMPVPVDLVTSSASGLDPQISPAATEYQVARVARARGLPEQTVRQLVVRVTRPRQLGILGEPRVNVLQLNLALDTVGIQPGRIGQ